MDLTSIEEVFYYQILMQKVLGHYMFDVPWRYVALAYRCLAPTLMDEISFYLDEVTLYYDSIKEVPATETSDRISRNFAFYEGIYGVMKRVATIHSIFIDFQLHETVRLIYRKRFQRQFLIEFNTRLGENPRRSTPNIDFLNRSTATIVIVMALISTLFEFILRSDEEEFEAAKRNNTTWSELGEEFTNSTNDDDANTSEFQDESSRALPALKYAARLALFLMGECLSHFYYLSFGQTTPILYVAACLNDILRRINEFSEWVENEAEPSGARPEVRTTKSGGKRGRRAMSLKQMPELTVLIQRARRQESSPIQTLKMLQHTRDVLITLRQVFSLSYLTLYVYSMTEMLVNVGYMVAIGSGQYMKQDLIFMMSFLGQFFKITQQRLVYTRLLDEVDAIRESYQKRLLDSSGRLTVEEQAIVKLAEEIGEIWPSGWIECDLQSYFSNVMSMFVFAINIHQAASKRL